MATVLITGATGLIGRHTLSAWPDELGRVTIRHDEHDLLAAGEFDRLISSEQPEIVVHLAWSASSTPGYRFHPDNASWRRVSAEAARSCARAGIGFVGLGTVVDDQAGDDPYTESKHGLRTDVAELIDDRRITWLRPFYVFDPDVPSPAVLREAIAARDDGRPAVLQSPGARHDFIHAADVGAAVVTAVRHGLRGAIDIGSGDLHRVSDLVKAVGGTWTDDPAAPSVTHADSVADATVLRDAGWMPVHTQRFFGEILRP